LTLGALLTLSVLEGAWADDLSWLSWSSLTSFLPGETTGIFPKLPENWSDLPVQLHISETVGYNSNITGAQTNNQSSLSSVFKPIGSLESISSYGFSFKNEVGAQQFFADGTWGMYRYARAPNFNSQTNAADIGDNFSYGSKCTGNVRLSEATSPSEPTQQLAVNTINSMRTVSGTENLQCIANGRFSTIFNSGITSSTNSAALDKLNDYRSAFIAAGINYTASDTDSLQILATLTGTDYNTGAQQRSSVTGLLNKLTTDQVMATYTKNVGQFSLSAQVGVLGVVDNEFFSFRYPRTILPQYSLNARWSVSPKLQAYVLASRLASAPTTIISNLQLTETAGAGVTYQWTPKISIGANLQISYNTAAGTPSTTTALFGQLGASQKTYSAGANVAYAITPFLAANLSYQYYRSLQANVQTDTSVILLALNFNPI